MPNPTKGPRLGGSPAHERLMMANLAASLFEHGRITTTQAKARRLRPFAERLITKAKRGDLHNRRQALRVIRDKDVLHKLFAEIGPFFAERNGGYVRITKTLPRKGDNAPMAVIELVAEKLVTAEAERARGTRFARHAKPVAETAPATASDSGSDSGSDSDSAAPAAVPAVQDTGETSPYGPGSHAALDDGSQPEGFPVKGNASSKLYHLPGSSHYERTVPDVWFASDAEAETAGFRLPPSQRDTDDSADSGTADS